MKHDWTIIKRDYVEAAPRRTLDAVAQQHGISPRLLRRRAAAEGWTTQRRELASQVDAQRNTAHVAAVAQDAGTFDRSAFETAARGLEHVAAALGDKPGPGELATLARALATFHATGRAALGLPDTPGDDPGTLTIRWLGHDPTDVPYD